MLLAATLMTSAAAKGRRRRLQGILGRAHSAGRGKRLVPDIVGSGVAFDEALKRFKAGRPYVAKVKKGVVTTSYRGPNGLSSFALNIPESYDPRAATRCASSCTAA